jgi:hypothetical protein
MAGRNRTPVRTTRSSSQHLPNRTALVASAAHYAGNVAPKVYGTDRGWQQEAYHFYSTIGRCRTAATYYGNAMGKCEMFMAEPVVDEKTKLRRWEPDYSGPEAQALDELFSGKMNQTQMQTEVGIHLTIGGECFIVGRYEGDPAAYAQSTIGDGAMIWEVLSPVEITKHGQGWALLFPGASPMPLTERDVVIRVWRPDPYQRQQADSPFKSLLGVLREVAKLTAHINSQLISRLAGAGIMFIPESMDFPDSGQEGEETTTANGPSRVMKLIADTGAAAIADPDSPAARTPIIIQVPDDLVEHAANLMHFWSDLDEKAASMRADAYHEFCVGMDLPAEMVEGMSSNSGTGGGSSNGVSHWGSWQIEESSIKMHTEPGMELLCNAVTIGYIRFMVPGTKQVVKFSTEGLKLRPDRSKESMELWDRGMLKDEAVLRENGFDISDLPDNEERKAWLVRKIAIGSNTPEQVAYAAQVIGVNLPSGVAEHPALSAPTATPAPETPSLKDHPAKPRDPDERLAANAALLVACHGMVLTALQRVGNRLVQ